jgi:hypothetical protein
MAQRIEITARPFAAHSLQSIRLPRSWTLLSGKTPSGGQHRCGEPFDMAASAFDLHEIARAEVRDTRVV